MNTDEVVEKWAGFYRFLVRNYEDLVRRWLASKPETPSVAGFVSYYHCRDLDRKEATVVLDLIEAVLSESP